MATLKVQLVCLTGAKFPVLPYTCALLETIAKSDPSLREVELEHLPYIFSTVEGGVDGELSKMSQADVFGFSCYPWNWRRTVKLAHKVRERFPNATLIAGGPLIPELKIEAEEFIKQGSLPFDIYVYGEGESQWREILRRLSFQGSCLQSIAGTFLVGPDLEILFFPVLAASRSPLHPQSSYIGNRNMMHALEECDRLGLPRIAVWETNRGCPYSCGFCNWGSAIRQRVRPQEESLLFAEADWFLANVDILNMGDANFGILPRDLKIAEYLASRAHGARLRQVVFSAAKNSQDRVAAISSTLYRSGLLKNGALIGLQSLNEDVLTEISRANISNDRLIASSRKFAELGVPFFFDLIIGLPQETEASFYEAMDRLLDLDPSDIRIHALALFPNSDIHTHRKKYRIETEAWRIYDDSRFPDEDEFFDVVVANHTMTRAELERAKSIAEMIEYLHMGKLLSYIAKYLKRAHGISYTSFYLHLFEKFRGTSTVIGDVASGGYFLALNSGSTTSLVGPSPPFGLSLQTRGFRKSTFIWLAVMQNRDEFFTEIEEELCQGLGVNLEVAKDLVAYQKEILISFEYDPSHKKRHEFVFDWHTFFKKPSMAPQPERVPTLLLYSDEEVAGQPIRPRDPNSYFHLAGGFLQNPDRTGLYEHKRVDHVREWVDQV